MSPRIRRTIVALVLLTALPVCGGCSGTVTGKVTLGAKPVTSAIVVFTTADGVPFSANVDNTGHYQLTKLPPGEMKISVTDPMVRSGSGPVKDPDAMPRTPLVPLIPKRYAIPDNGLKYMVQPGTQTHDLELSP